MGDVVYLFEEDNPLIEYRELVEEQDIQPASRKGILAHLAWRLNEKTGDCYPSVKTIAKAVGCSQRTVERQIQELKKAGTLRWMHGKKPDGSNTSNRYVLNVNGYDSSKPEDLVRLKADRQNVGTPTDTVSVPPRQNGGRTQCTKDRFKESTSGVLPRAEEVTAFLGAFGAEKKRLPKGTRDPKDAFARISLFMWGEQESMLWKAGGSYDRVFEQCCRFSLTGQHNQHKVSNGQKLMIARGIRKEYERNRYKADDAVRELVRKAVEAENRLTAGLNTGGVGQ